jgi:glycosyltransferase involved in cell wall biosynthesis
MVAIPNHHFFQWVNQLENSGYEVFWFDITDGGPKSDKIKWVTQIKNWKLKWDFPLRSTVKKRLPKLYKIIQKINENNVTSVFQKIYDSIKPDIVHCFEMQISGLPILPIMLKNNTPLVYSSWGSDMFYFENLGVSKQEIRQFLSRVNYLITDCKRDYHIAKDNGFNANYLGVFPGNGGLKINTLNIKPTTERDIIMIKGYEDGVGKASVVLNSLVLVDIALLENKKIVIYSADNVLESQIKASNILSKLNITIYYRHKFIENDSLLELMGKSSIHIANSVSDGMPNALLEAMSMGAFPIQSNPGNVTQEMITDGLNGFLINNPLDNYEIAELIEDAIKNEELRMKAQNYNITYMALNNNRSNLQSKIVHLYQIILN